jgi:hypothetical protein
MNRTKACERLHLQEPFTIKTLRKQYHALCLKYHPDKNKDSTHYINIKEAYDFLLEDLKRVSPLFYMDEDYTHKLYIVLKKYMIEPLEQHMSTYKIYELNPTLENLFNKDVYYLKEYDVYIPLWHHELWYEEQHIKIKIKPRLPDHVSIDIYNNIHIYLEVNTKTFGETISLTLGNETVEFVYTDTPSIVIQNRGIPTIQEKIFEYALSTIYIHLS